MGLRSKRPRLGTARRTQLPLIPNPIRNGSSSSLDSDASTLDRDDLEFSRSYCKDDACSSLADGQVAPAFRPRREASTIELFFDLFFVANLTAFTSLDEIESPQGREYQGLPSIPDPRRGRINLKLNTQPLRSPVLAEVVPG